MSRYYGVSTNRVGKTFNSSFKILWAFSFPIAVGATLVAQPLIIWLYTDKFAPSGLVLAILIWALPVLNLSSLCGSIATATDKEKTAAKVYTMVAVLNITSNLIAIPLWGYIGAAVSTVLTEVVSLILLYRVLHPEFPLVDLKNVLLKPVLAGLFMGGVLMILPDWPVIVVIAIGAVIYALTLLALKPFNQAESEALQGLWSGVRRQLRWGVSQ
jgi:O-antigen/teichoic acid export membrane protein